MAPLDGVSLDGMVQGKLEGGNAHICFWGYKYIAYGPVAMGCTSRCTQKVGF